jgi:hypothetical protein
MYGTPVFVMAIAMFMISTKKRRNVPIFGGSFGCFPKPDPFWWCGCAQGNIRDGEKRGVRQGRVDAGQGWVFLETRVFAGIDPA